MLVCYRWFPLVARSGSSGVSADSRFESHKSAEWKSNERPGHGPWPLSSSSLPCFWPILGAFSLRLDPVYGRLTDIALLSPFSPLLRGFSSAPSSATENNAIVYVGHFEIHQHTEHLKSKQRI